MAGAKEDISRNYVTTRTLYTSLPFDSGQATLFVREKGSSITINDSDSTEEPPRKVARISGEEARQFYEDVLLMPKESKTNECSTKSRRRPVNVRKRKKKEAKSQKPLEITSQSQLFLCAQRGDLEPIKLALSSDFCDINVIDSFNWTLLMCASHAGHMSTVRYLLNQGADWRHYTDRRGNNAADLARIAGHPDIAELIENHVSMTTHGVVTHSHEHTHSHTGRKVDKDRGTRQMSSHDIILSTSGKSHEQSSFYCEICKMTVDLGASTVSNHTTSTVHQFSCQHKPTVTPYGIPESNRGFQLLLKGGWDPERGLGPDQQGRQFPVKTVLKRDRLGFGVASRTKPRVTHFSAHDEAAVKSQRERRDAFRTVKAQLKKKDIVKAAEKGRRWEIRMRRYMNTDYDLPL